MIEITSERKLNIEKLEKGDFISEEVLRVITGFDPIENPKVYSMALLRLRSHIEKARGFVMTSQGDSIRILTDPEEVFYDHATVFHGVNKVRRGYDRSTRIDESKLDEPTKARYRKNLEEQSRYLSALTQTSKQIRIERSQERLARVEQEQPIRIITLGGKPNGTQTNGSRDQRDCATGIARHQTGESIQPANQADEGDHQQEEENGS